MKKRVTCGILVLLVSLLCVCSIVSGLEESPNNAEEVVIDLELTTEIQIVQKTGDAIIDHLTANLSFVPLDYPGQEVISQKTEPQANADGNQLYYRWEDPVPNKIMLKLDTRVKNKNTLPKIRQTGFPIEVPAGLEPYTQASEKITSNDPAIIRQASILAAGETDLFSTVFKIAKWTKTNIAYNLSTLTSKATEDATWVLQNKQGVCDEIATVFIAMLRSLGIPAKFVSGIAYTESPLFPRNWGGHGWAEVYFPGTGWVPFDVTYGQYGWIDPTHVKSQEEIDSGAPSIRYQWLGRDVDVKTSEIRVVGDLVSQKGQVSDPISVEISAMQPLVGFGSYNLLEVKLKNKLDTYTAATAYLALINELEYIDKPLIETYLRPKGERTEYVLVKVKEDLNPGYAYTFPIGAQTQLMTQATGEFAARADGAMFSKEEMEEIKKAKETEEKKIYSKKIGASCETAKEYYLYDTVEVECTAKNLGNFLFEDLKFCVENECENKDLAIGQEKKISYVIDDAHARINKIRFTVTGKDVAKTEFVDIEVMAEPELGIDEFNYPANIEYEKDYTFEFKVIKGPSVAVNTTLNFCSGGNCRELELGDVTEDKKYLFNLNSEDLTTRPNPIKIELNYSDKNGKTYSTQASREINLINVTFGQKVKIWLRQIDNRLRSLL